MKWWGFQKKLCYASSEWMSYVRSL